MLEREQTPFLRIETLELVGTGCLREFQPRVMCECGFQPHFPFLDASPKGSAHGGQVLAVAGLSVRHGMRR